VTITAPAAPADTATVSKAEAQKQEDVKRAMAASKTPESEEEGGFIKNPLELGLVAAFYVGVVLLIVLTGEE